MEVTLIGPWTPLYVELHERCCIINYIINYVSVISSQGMLKDRLQSSKFKVFNEFYTYFKETEQKLPDDVQQVDAHWKTCIKANSPVTLHGWTKTAQHHKMINHISERFELITKGNRSTKCMLRQIR